jgi:hypothetical protein
MHTDTDDERFLCRNGWYCRGSDEDEREWSHDLLTTPNRWVPIGEALRIQIRICAGTGSWKTG